MKSLKIIQTIAKILRIICIVVFVFCIVGAAGCAIGLICFSILKDVVVYQDKTLTILIAEKGASVADTYAGMIVGLLSCGFGIFLAKYNELFYKEEIALGTPFKHDFVKKMRKVALVNIIVSFALAVVAGISVLIVALVFQTTLDFKYELFSTIGYGLMLLFISLFCEYGADVTEPKIEAPAVEETPKEE